jgi:hypothetical protein
MPFIVEDGTIVAGANSYIPVAFADSYFADRGGAAWAALPDDAAKQPFLIKATDYIEGVFSLYFVGVPTTSLIVPAVTPQPLSWPRNDTDIYTDLVISDDEIPELLKRAVCEYAVQAILGPLAPVPLIDATGFSVVNTRKKLGPLEKDFKVPGQATRPIVIRPYPTADLLIRPLLRRGAFGTRVNR